MRTSFLIAAMTLLAACGQQVATSTPSTETTQAESAQNSAPQNHLACADFANVTLASLQERFGAENVADQTLNGPEGMQYVATVVFANDATRRLQVIWAEGAEHARAQTILVEGEGNTWIGPSGLEVGMPLVDLEAANGGPVNVSGFGWDYGGGVTDWRGGNLDRVGCHVMARLNPQGEAPGVQGEGIFSSDLPAMRAANARVYQYGLSYPQE